MKALVRIRKSLKAFRHAQSGVAAIEFAVFATLGLVILAAIVDFGGIAYARFRLESALSAGANYAIVSNASITASAGSDLASAIAAIVADTDHAIAGEVVLNNGPTATFSGGGVTSAGQAGNADSCYCPQAAGTTLNWGPARTCETACPFGGRAGKYVEISAETSYTPFFFGYGIIEGGTIAARAVVQAQ